MSDKVDVIREWYEDIWIAGNIDRIADLYQPADDKHCLIKGATISQSEARELVSVLGGLVSDQHISVLHAIELGDWVSAIIQMDGKRTDTGAPVRMRWNTYIRVADGRIVESYPSINFLSFFEQLGQLPKNSFELLLGGTVLR